MNHRERVLAAIHHQPVDRVPTDIWATPEVQERLYAHLGIQTGRGAAVPGISLMGGGITRHPQALLQLFDRLNIDGIFYLTPPYVGPPLRTEGDYTFNEWGMGHRDQAYQGGIYSEQVIYPLAEVETIADLEAYRWPDPDWYDYDALPKLAELCGGRAIGCGYAALFFYHNLLRGLEQSLMDPILRPEFTQHLIGRISAFFQEYHRRCFEAAHQVIDVTQVTDDLGSQHGPLISPAIFDAFYREPIQRAIDLAKSYDLVVFHHDDGDMRAFLPRLVEMGIDVLNPIQWRCGNWDLRALKRDYGRQLCFHSAVDNQQTLPYGAPQDVRAEVRRLIDTLASDGTGFIIGPCHNLQVSTSVANIVALYEAAAEFGASPGDGRAPAGLCSPPNRL